MPMYTVEYRSASKEVYRKFANMHPDMTVDSKTWTAIVRSFNELFAEYLLQTGEREKLPYGLGSFAISKKKTVKIIKHNDNQHISLPVDWKRSKEVGKKIYILNSHSDGFRVKWKWFKEDTNVRLSQAWMFKVVRNRSRDIARYLKNEDGQHYLEKWRQWEKKS